MIVILPGQTDLFDLFLKKTQTRVELTVQAHNYLSTPEDFYSGCHYGNIQAV